MDVTMGPATVSLPALDPSGLDVATMDEAQRIDALVALQRARAWVDAAETRLLAALAEPGAPTLRFAMSAAAADNQYVREQLACALRVAPVTVNERLHVAGTAVRDLPRLLAALETGDTPMRHLRVAVDAVNPLDHDARLRFDADVAGAARVQTSSQFRRSAARAVLAADPRGAAERHDDARTGRAVAWFAEPDGMGTLRATLPAEDLAAVREVIQAAADHHPAHRDHCGWAAADRAHRAAEAAATAGDSPLDGQAPRRGRGTSDRALLDPDCPGCAHLLLTADQRRADALVALLLDVDTARVRSRHGRRPDIQVTVALSTLLHHDDRPGELSGHGPVPATLARHLAADPTGTWHRLVTDPVGHLIDYGRTTYRPPQDLTDHVIARDIRCRFPGCGRQARTSDLDHLVAWADGGTTSTDNLLAGCPRHHHLRHDAPGWTVTGNPEHALTWTTPTGHSYTDPPGTLPLDTTAEPRPDDVDRGTDGHTAGDTDGSNDRHTDGRTDGDTGGDSGHDDHSEDEAVAVDPGTDPDPPPF